MNKFEILGWGLLISFVTAVLCGAVLLWWLARKEHDTKQKGGDEPEKLFKPCTCGSKYFVDQDGYLSRICYRCGGEKSFEEFKQSLKGVKK
ncbi:putative phage replication protein [Acinetobacter pittii]|nr:putative phage replication protein [Acinetobacter pittii]